MSPRPVLFRARVALACQSRYPRGFTSGEVLNFISPGSFRASEVREILDGMVEDGLLSVGEQQQPHGRAPLPVYLASGSLRGVRTARGAGCEPTAERSRAPRDNPTPTRYWPPISADPRQPGAAKSR